MGTKRVISNIRVFTGDDFIHGGIVIKDERIEEVFSGNKIINCDELIDGEQQIAIPGLVDIHFHGAVGNDFCDADIEGLEAISEYEARNGILAICPATMTYDEEKLMSIMQVGARYAKLSERDYSKADLVGINLEGPFISPQKLGAQNPVYQQNPDIQMFRRLQNQAEGMIKVIDIAPELEGAFEFIEELKNEVKISIAHTNASYEIAKEAFERGITHVTHLYNAMPEILHRDPGPVGAAIEAKATAELICDGIHNHESMIRLAFNIFKDRIILVSDSMEATGLGDGTYRLGGQRVTVNGNKAVIADKPDIIAGSVTNLYNCMKKAIFDDKIPLGEAIRSTTINPARVIGIDKDYGSLEKGKLANIILVDDDFTINSIISRGETIMP